MRELFNLAVDILETLGIRAILGFIIVFFLPGFAWSLVFFSKITVLERIVLSLGLSIAIVTLTIMALNVLFKVPITGLNSLIIIMVITLIPVAFYYVSRLTRKDTGEA